MTIETYFENRKTKVLPVLKEKKPQDPPELACCHASLLSTDLFVESALMKLFIRFYQPYFDITTDDVKQRILATVDPRKNTFFETLDNRPDL